MSPKFKSAHLHKNPSQSSLGGIFYLQCINLCDKLKQISARISSRLYPLLKVICKPEAVHSRANRKGGGNGLRTITLCIVVQHIVKFAASLHPKMYTAPKASGQSCGTDNCMCAATIAIYRLIYTICQIQSTCWCGNDREEYSPVLAVFCLAVPAAINGNSDDIVKGNSAVSVMVDRNILTVRIDDNLFPVLPLGPAIINVLCGSQNRGRKQDQEKY